jgi:hypothetical protein
VAGERRVPELCGGAGCVSDFGEPGPGWGDRWIFADTDAFGWNRVRHCVAIGKAHPHSNVRQFLDAGGAMRGADDRADGDLAVHGEREDGSTARADELDSGDGGGQSAACGVQPVAPDFGFAGEWRVAGGISSYVLDATRVSGGELSFLCVPTGYPYPLPPVLPKCSFQRTLSCSKSTLI